MGDATEVVSLAIALRQRCLAWHLGTDGGALMNQAILVSIYHG